MTAKLNIAWTLLLVIGGLYVGAVPHRPPNMVIILMDDVGYGDLGCYWNPTGQSSNTPFLDYLAENGIRFTDFHSPASLCTPSRGSLLTGRLCLRTGFPTFLPKGFVGGLPTNETTFGETFKAAGYRTGIIGKWDLGIYGGYHPTSRGFDFFFGLPYSNNYGCTLGSGGTLLPNPCPRTWSDATGYSASNCSLSVPLLYDRMVVEQPVNQTSLSFRYAEMAKQFINNGSKPYLLYVGLAHMHIPLFHMPEFEGMSESNSVYGDTLLEMDYTIKTIVEAIKDSGEAENTLVWIASDNGPSERECQYGGNPGPFIGEWQRREGGGGSAAKGTPFEAGHRVPSIVYWPGTIKGGQVSNATISGMDIYPTMAALANIQMPGNRTYDGMDISDLLMGKPVSRKRVLYHPIINVVNGKPKCVIEAMRIGDYKAFFNTGFGTDCEGNVGIKETHFPPLIFDLKEDPMESTPLKPDTSLFGHILEDIHEAMADIEHSVEMDQTPLEPMEYDPCGNPCCNPLNVVCRCD